LSWCCAGTAYVSRLQSFPRYERHLDYPSRNRGAGATLLSVRGPPWSSRHMHSFGFCLLLVKSGSFAPVIAHNIVCSTSGGGPARVNTELQTWSIVIYLKKDSNLEVQEITVLRFLANQPREMLSKKNPEGSLLGV
jgi:hypothetical protein